MTNDVLKRSPTLNYLLDDNHNLIPVRDITKWGLGFEKMDRLVRRDLIKENGVEVLVSTVFLGIDHNYSDAGPPLLFETMALDEETFREFDETLFPQNRYSTWDEALEGHNAIVSDVRKKPLNHE